MAIVEIPLYGLLPLKKVLDPEICINCNEEQLDSDEFIHPLPLVRSKAQSLDVICNNCDKYICLGSELNQNYTCESCVEEQFQNGEIPPPPTLVRQNAHCWSSHEELEKDLYGDKFCNRCHKCYQCQ